MTYDFPPVFIVKGDLAGQGEFDQKLRYFIERMPEFNHRIEVSSFTRAWYTLAHEDGVCVLGAFRSPERENIGLFSRAAFSSLGLGLAVRTVQLPAYRPYLDATGAIDLAALEKASPLKGVYTKGRVYDPVVDRYIDKKRGGPSLVVAQNITNAFKMIAATHADYTFAFPHEVAYFQSAQGARTMTLLPMRHLPKVYFSHIACSDGPVGRKVIATVDDLILRAGIPPRYISIGLKWMRPDQLALLNDRSLWTEVRDQETRAGKEPTDK